MLKRELGMMAALLLLVGAIAFQVPGKLFSEYNLFNLGQRISLLSILAIGEAVVIIAGGFDLAVGSLIGLTALTCTILAAEGGWPLGAALGAAMAVALAAGALQGALITGLNLQPFIVTLGGMMLFRGLADTISGGRSVGYGTEFPEFKAWGSGSFLHLPRQLWVLFAVGGLAFFLMRMTLFGRYCYAVGSNAEAARLSGVPVRRVRFFTYLISGGLAGLTGILYSAYNPSCSHSTGEMYELYAIAAAVLGGCSLRGGQGSVLGVLIGASIMYVIYNGINLLQVPTQWERVIVGTIILIAAVVDELLARRRKAR
jgi:ribose transport system permease protein